MRFSFFVLICMAGIAATLPAFGQFNCDVTVNMEKIPGSIAGDQLVQFESDIESYLNSTNFVSSADFDKMGNQKIKVTMTIFFVAASGENKYTAQLFVGSQRPIYAGKNPSNRVTAMVRLFDDAWEFTYIKNQPLYHDDTRFDALTDMLDFYMYLVLGYDFDSYEKFGGTPFFQKANTICNQAPSSAKGWARAASSYNKFSLVEELLNAKYQPLREGMYLYHYQGLDRLATKPEVGLKNIHIFLQSISEIRKMVNPRSISVKSFFDTKYMELAEIFKKYQDKSVYLLLSQIDPGHQNSYDEARKE